MNLRLLVISFLAVLLIAGYIYFMLGACFPDNIKINATGANFFFSAVGGLVSAFAISFLAVAEPNTIPTAGLTLTTNPKEVIGQKIQKAIPATFVLTWLICGALATYFGLFAAKTPSALLPEMAKAWLGTVVAAVGAFYGIKP